MRTLKDYTAEQIAAAKTWMSNELEAMSEANYDKTLLQVLEFHHPTGHVEDIQPVVMAAPKPLEGEFQQGEEPVLEIYGKEDEVKAMPEFSQSGPKEFEDKVVQRLMLAMARGEIKLELDGTPEGKARDAKVVKDYLTRNAAYYPHESRDEWLRENGGVSSDGKGTLWFEYPGDGMSDINPPRPTEQHGAELAARLANQKFPLDRFGKPGKGVEVTVHPDHLVMLDKPVYVEIDISKLAEGDSYITPDGKTYTKVHGRMVPADAVQTALSSIHLDRPTSAARQQMHEGSRAQQDLTKPAGPTITTGMEIFMDPMSIAKRLVGPWDGPGWDKGMDEKVRQERLELFETYFANRHPDLSRGKDVKLHIVPVKKDD
jgi:hypothetical protein